MVELKGPQNENRFAQQNLPSWSSLDRERCIVPGEHPALQPLPSVNECVSEWVNVSAAMRF